MLICAVHAQADTSHDQPKCMLICAKSLVDAHTCRRTQSPQYITTCEDNQHCSECTTTNADTCSAFNTGQLLLIHAKLLIRALHSRLLNHENKQIHSQLSIRANTCRIMTEFPEVLRHADSCSALDTGPHMMIHIQAPIQTNMCRYLPSSQYMQKHVYTRSALHTGQHILSQLSIMQKDATRNTCRHTSSS
jgi:hypothetical protein